MNYNAWEVWAAEVRFEDSPVVKTRPVLVLDDQVVYAVCLKMTSAAPRAGEYPLVDWPAVGLKKPTTVRLSKLLHLTPRDMKYKIGDLSPIDIANIQLLLI